jgi:hypothetical protein
MKQVQRLQGIKYNSGLGQNTGIQKNWLGHAYIKFRNKVPRIMNRRHTSRARSNQETIEEMARYV